MIEPPFVYIDPLTLATADEALAEVDCVLAHMQDVAAGLSEADIASGVALDWFADRTDWLKRYFERAEALVLTNE